LYGLYDYDSTLGLQRFVYCVGDLSGKALLELGPARVCVHHARELREARHPTIREVPYVSSTREREEMMFAHRGYPQVTDEDQIARLFGEASFEVTSRVFSKAGEERCIGVGDTLRRIQQALSIRVLADGDQYLSHRPRDALLRAALLLTMLFACHVCL
jgi:hypothetical protein